MEDAHMGAGPDFDVGGQHIWHPHCRNRICSVTILFARCHSCRLSSLARATRVIRRDIGNGHHFGSDPLLSAVRNRPHS